jgi:hypothetical protein
MSDLFAQGVQGPGNEADDGFAIEELSFSGGSSDAMPCLTIHGCLTHLCNTGPPTCCMDTGDAPPPASE